MRDYNSMCMEFESERRQFRAIQYEFLALREECFNLKKASITSDALIASQCQDIESLTKEVEKSVQFEINLEAKIESLERQYSIEIESLVQVHHSKLDKVYKEFVGTKKELVKLHWKW